MGDGPSASSDDQTLHDYVDASFTLAEALTPTAEKSVRDALDQLAGVKSVSLVQKTVAVHYDPTETAQTKIASALESAGVRIEDAKVTPSSPMTDALAEKSAPSEESSGEE